MLKTRIYLDNNATTRPSEGVIAAMSTVMRESFYNPSSPAGIMAGAAAFRDSAAATIAAFLHADDPDGFIFTSGATESNNWLLSAAVQGMPNGRIVISAVEHPSVSECCAALAKQGSEVVVVRVDSNGLIDLEMLEEALAKPASVISVVAANNETGVLQPIAQVGALVRSKCPQALFHTDATQAIGKVDINLAQMWADVDALSFSAHKFFGPKGIGGLYCRPGIELEPMIHGGGQEGGRRAGTSNTPAFSGLAVALQELAPSDFDPVSRRRDAFEDKLMVVFPEATIHAKGVSRLPNTSCFSISGVTGDDVAQMLALRGIVVGVGSACSSGSLRPPKTLLAMGVEHSLALSALRVSLSPSTTNDELDQFLIALSEVVPFLKK